MIQHCEPVRINCDCKSRVDCESIGDCESVNSKSTVSQVKRSQSEKLKEYKGEGKTGGEMRSD